ncbi:MAG: recombinase family protein [Deltaproteobacteria bacterium]|nr:recombinase family protein [Deltaproteobacteria bacterium]
MTNRQKTADKMVGERTSRSLAAFNSSENLNVLNVFKLIESSTQGDRKAFHQMIEVAKAQKEIVAMVADAGDRIQRSFKESVMLDQLIRAEKIELHFNREGMILNHNAISTDIMRWDFSHDRQILRVAIE